MSVVNDSAKKGQSAPEDRLTSLTRDFRNSLAAALSCVALFLIPMCTETARASWKLGPSSRIPQMPASDSQTVSFEVQFRFHMTETVSKLWYITGIPKTIKNRQHVLELRFSPEPVAVYDDDETRYAVFSFTDSSGNLDVHISGRIELYRYDIEIAMAAHERAGVKLPSKLSDAEMTEALRAEHPFDVKNPIVRKVSEGLKGPTERLPTGPSGHDIEALRKAELDTMQDILGWIKQHVKYEDHAERGRTAGRAMALGKGDCGDFSNVFVTLCRAKGIPAHRAVGLTAYFENSPTHAWAEVFVSGLGWTPFDPTWINSIFEKLKPVYIRSATTASNSAFGPKLHYEFRYWCDRGNPDIEVSRRYHFRPD